MEAYGGGSWSDQKIKALRRYLDEYMKILKDKPSPHRPFKKIYFDAFCGSGGRLTNELPLFEGQELVSVTEISPRTALEVVPRFDQYIFCDINKSYVSKLKTVLRDEEQNLNGVEFRIGDANDQIRGFCETTDWSSSRCVMFMDPLGLSVSWSTLETVANTKAIDLWYLFPSGLGPTRMTPRSGKVPDKWAKKLTDIWGDESWMRVGYTTTKSQNDLFGYSARKLEKTGTAVDYELAFIKKMKEIFDGGVSKSGLRLHNSKGSHMFSLLFACANGKPAAFGPALDIANHIINMRVR